MQHDWIPSTLGHGETMCRRCFVTNLEAAALGIMNACDVAPPPPTAASQIPAISVASIIIGVFCVAVLIYSLS